MKDFYMPLLPKKEFKVKAKVVKVTKGLKIKATK